MGKKTIITEVEEGCLVLFCIYLSKLEFSWVKRRLEIKFGRYTKYC
jgi:hypothetical protein